PHAPDRFPVWTVLLVALPVLLGIVVPARPLGASAVDNKGVNVSAPLAVASGSGATTLEIAPEKRTILDWVRAFNYADDPATFTSQPADVIGFVFHDEQFGPTQVMVGRFTVTCCAADASAVAMLVEWPDAATLPDNAWVRVRGPVTVATLNGKPIPLITAAAIETVAQPEHPYMYP
ncbi:MAG: TIGR03943 family putative permease subunit, partial [Anaerolineales bacterium]